MLLQQLLSAALLLIAPAPQTPRVSAQLTANTIAVGETVTVQVIVDGANDDVDIHAPSFPGGLTLIGTQDFSEMSFSLPGGQHVTRRREFALQATAPGNYTIPPVVVTIGNRAYRTNPLNVIVSGTAQAKAVASNDDAWLHATMSPETVYVGQQATLTIEAGFSEDVRMRLTRPPVFDAPSPTGFWVQDVPGGVTSRLRPVNGRVMEIQSLQRAYFPLSDGKFALAPATATIDVREGFLFAPETHEIRSPSPKLIVLSLPERGQPHDFHGAVGSYVIRAYLQPDTVGAGEAAQLTIELSGNGNVKALPPPVLPEILGVEQFPPTEDAKITFDGAIAGGTKVFQWVLIPQHAGVVRIPSISYSFFDPSTREYRVIATSPLTLVATVATVAGDTITPGTALRAFQSQSRYPSLAWVREPWFLLAQLLPLLALLGIVVTRRMRGRRSDADDLQAELARVRTSKTGYADFLRDLESLVRRAVKLRVNDAGVPAANALIERIEAQRFASAGIESAEREALLAEAAAVIRNLMRAERATAHASVALLVLGLVAPGQQFDAGVQLYRNGHFAEAAQTFERYAHSNPHDIAAWSNLGNAYFRSDQRGRAVWAWARALREAPRDRATVSNLQAAGAVEVLRTRPPLSVRAVEWYLLAALAWWVACLVAITAYWRRGRELWWWCTPGLLIAVIALAIGIFADHQKYGVALDDETKLYGDPTVHSPVVRSVQAGAGLDILETRGEWVRVRTLTQAEGWAEADAVGRL